MSQWSTGTPLPRGTCQRCGRSVALKNDGSPRSHLTPPPVSHCFGPVSLSAFPVVDAADLASTRRYSTAASASRAADDITGRASSAAPHNDTAGRTHARPVNNSAA